VTVWVQAESGGDQVLRAKWNRTYSIQIPESGAVVETGYGTYNWADANPAKFTVRPGDAVEYQAFWWPVRRGQVTIGSRRRYPRA
jgi:hypothetical protein